MPKEYLQENKERYFSLYILKVKSEILDTLCFFFLNRIQYVVCSVSSSINLVWSHLFSYFLIVIYSLKKGCVELYVPRGYLRGNREHSAFYTSTANTEMLDVRFCFLLNWIPHYFWSDENLLIYFRTSFVQLF